MTYLFGGVLFGLAASVHCAGMCGPLLLAFARGVRPMMSYHAARVFMYVLLGIPAGYAGRALSFGAAGRSVAIVAGVLLILAATGSLGSKHFEAISRVWTAATVRAGAKATAFTRRHPRSGFAVLGALNGLLPCGMVYAAATAAAACGTVAASMTFMAGFGAGTVPILVAMTLTATSLPALLRRRLRLVAPALMALAGVLFLARALMPVDSHLHHAHQQHMSAMSDGPRR